MSEKKISIIKIFLPLVILAVIIMISICTKDLQGPLPLEEPVTTSILPEEKRVLYIASYSLEDEWSSSIKGGIQSVLSSRENTTFKAVSMETMGMTASDRDKVETAALEAKELIDSWKPHVVITSDDNAAKYLIVPYFKDKDLPFVFCGVNWDASKYGFPSKNVTGVIEVYLADQLVDYLITFAKGERIGSLRGNTMTNRGEADFFEAQIGLEISNYFVDNISDWKKIFIQLQDEVDIILLGDINAVKINSESKEEIERFMLENTRIPTGRWDEHYKDDALITVGAIPAEQGELAARAALKILEGSSPLEIPIVKNKKAELFLNMDLAKKLGIIFPMELIESATFVQEN